MNKKARLQWQCRMRDPYRKLHFNANLLPLHCNSFPRSGLLALSYAPWYNVNKLIRGKHTECVRK